jgi:hypothetical protein
MPARENATPPRHTATSAWPRATAVTAASSERVADVGEQTIDVVAVQACVVERETQRLGGQVQRSAAEGATHPCPTHTDDSDLSGVWQGHGISKGFD